ncbi:unnamed protein product [marine sediment metagenome]|uniref:Uncharacterized protein n=1 Tax=marine sediment metagenome TaxID=412755 RepID=X1TKU8_9ZZZZ
MVKQLIIVRSRGIGKMIEWVKQLRPEVHIEESNCQKKLKNLQVENKRLRNEIKHIGYNCFDLMEGAGMPEFEIYEDIWVWSIGVLKGESNGKTL